MVDGVDVVIGTSSFLREHSHGKDMEYITKSAIEVIEYIKSKGLEVRCEYKSIPLAAIRQPASLTPPRTLFLYNANSIEVSSEDSFRSDLVDLLSLYKKVDEIGVNRVGIADTVGCATPRQVYEVCIFPALDTWA